MNKDDFSWKASRSNFKHRKIRIKENITPTVGINKTKK